MLLTRKGLGLLLQRLDGLVAGLNLPPGRLDLYNTQHTSFWGGVGFLTKASDSDASSSCHFGCSLVCFVCSLNTSAFPLPRICLSMTHDYAWVAGRGFTFGSLSWQAELPMRREVVEMAREAKAFGTARTWRRRSDMAMVVVVVNVVVVNVVVVEVMVASGEVLRICRYGGWVCLAIGR